MIFHSFYQWVSILALTISAGAGLWRGQWPERVAAIAMIVAWMASALLFNGTQLWGPQTGVMLVDSLLLAVLLVIALRSDRWWPMWACGFHGMNVLLHLTVMLDAAIWGRAYYVASAIFSYLTMLALFIGALGRSARRAVEDPLID